MKSSKLSETLRKERKWRIADKRDALITAWRERGRSVIKYACTLHKHSGAKQRARYARQIAVGQIKNAACVNY